jgi:transposase
MLPRSSYPDDLTDEEWLLISRLVHLSPSSIARKGRYSKCEMLNALFYLLRSGCSWRHLPHDFPPWKSRWKQQEVIEE